MSIEREYKMLPIEQLHRCPTQPRQYFDQESLASLAKSIASMGIIEDIVVRPMPSLNNKPSHQRVQYQIVAGERRWRAAQIAELDKVPCVIRYNLTDLQATMLALTENLQRQELNPIEEARAYQHIQENFNLTQEEIADQLGVSRPHITNILRLLKLSRKIQMWIVEGKLNAGHGKILAKFDHIVQEEWASRSIAKNWTANDLEKELKSKKQHKIAQETADAESLERNLSEYFSCPVKLYWKEKKNLITIQCSNLDILNGVIEKMGYQGE